MKNLITYDEFLNEGRYDKLTSIAVKSMWPMIKATRILDDSAYELSMGEVSNNGIYFDLNLELYREPVKIAQGFIVDAGAYTTRGNNAIEVIITIDPTKEPQIYNKLNAKLQDAMRHEIEHLTQAGVNKVPGKPTATRAKTRNKINVDNNNIHKYFLLRDEVPAMVQGMYKQAKTEKRKLDEIFNEYLDYFIDENVITQKEKDRILVIWMEFAKANLPAAQYTKK